jgi:hypothetical protein
MSIAKENVILLDTAGKDGLGKQLISGLADS